MEVKIKGMTVFELTVCLSTGYTRTVHVHTVLCVAI